MFKSIFNKDPYNQASKLFEKIRNLKPLSKEYWLTIVEIMVLCQKAIKINKHNGDALVLLANVYYLAALGAFREYEPDGYIYNMSCSAAVIYEWKTNLILYTKFKQNGEKIYSGVVERLEDQMPEWLNMTLSKDIKQLHKSFYKVAIESGLKTS